MKIFKKVAKYITVVFFCLLFVLVVFPTKRSSSLKKANADSLNAYPTVCLGGWQNPSNAAGQPDVQAGSNSFSSENSAVLDQAQAQIFCGSFQSGDESRTPTSVTLHFSWNIVFPSQATTSASTDTDSSAWSSVLDTTSTPTSTVSSTLPSAPLPSSTSTDATGQDENASSTSVDQNQNGTMPATSTSASTDSGDSSVTASSSQDAAPPPAPSAPDQSDQNQSSTSFLEKTINDSLAFFIQKTFADSNGTAENFINVSYSLNGTNWQDLGQVSSADWQNFSVIIPVSSWDDINKLQIQLNPLLAVDAPAVYLDGMWLEIDYHQSLSGILQDGANTALNAVGDLSDAVNGALNNANNALTNLLSPGTTNIQSQDSSKNTNAPQPASAPPPPPPHRHTFQVNSTLPADVRNPSWVPADQAKNYNAGLAGQGSALPTVTLADKNTIHISGKCSEDYYTVLLFANKTDYENNPAAAVYNVATPCVNGSFNETLSDANFPPNLKPGTYYLVVANQGKTGPWQPYPTLYPILIGNASSSE